MRTNVVVAVLLVAATSGLHTQVEADVWFFVLPDYPNGGSKIVDEPGIITLDVMVFNQFDDGDFGDLSQVRFLARIPECFVGAVHLTDIPTFETIGSSQTGATVMFSPCLSSGNTLNSVLRIQIFAQGLTRNECFYEVSPHPDDTGDRIVALNCFGFQLNTFDVPTPVVPSTIASEATTWGRIKALYRGGSSN